MRKLVNVFLQGSPIGQIALLPGEKTLFLFEDNYLESSSPPTLSQSFISKSGELIPQSRPIQTRLHPFFSNLLPEGHLREYLALKNQVNPRREFPFIEALGEDLPGAVVVRPIPTELRETNLDNPLIPPEKRPYRFSLAGIQLKFSALMKKQGGLTIPASGVGGTWIIKLPSSIFSQIPENEFAMLTLAKHVGIEVPDFKLIPLEDIEGLPSFDFLLGHQALAVKRFDRGIDQKRIHMEDFAQVYGLYPEQKYSKVSYTNIANMIWTLCGEKGLTEYIERLVFSILIGNGDMHLKNWSFIYPNGRTPELSPAYDFLSTIPYIPGDNLALTLVKTKRMHLCTENLFEALVEKAKLPKHLVLTTVRRTVEATRKSWSQLKPDIILDQKIISAIDEHMKSIPL